MTRVAWLLLVGVLALSLGAYVFFGQKILYVGTLIVQAAVSPLFWSKAWIVARLWLGKMSWRFVLFELPKKIVTTVVLPILFIFGFNRVKRQYFKELVASFKEIISSIKTTIISRLERYFGKKTSLAIALTISLGVFLTFFITFGAYMIIWTGKFAIPNFITVLIQRIGFKTTIFASVSTAWKKWVEPLVPEPSRWWKRLKYRSARFAIKQRWVIGRHTRIIHEKLKKGKMMDQSRSFSGSKLYLTLDQLVRKPPKPPKK